MNSSDRQLLILIAGVVFILVQALAISYKIWWLTFTASGMGLLFAAFLPRAAALPTSKNTRPKAEDWTYGQSRDSLKGQYSKVETGESDVPTTDFHLAEDMVYGPHRGSLSKIVEDDEPDVYGLPRSSLKGRYSERVTGDDPNITTPFLRLKTPRSSRDYAE